MRKLPIITLVLASMTAFVAGPTGMVSEAHAQASPDATTPAIALFQEGVKLKDEQKFAESIPKFEQSIGLVPSAASMFQLADSYEKVGRTASAWGMFKQSAAQARKDNRPQIVEEASGRAQALEPKLSRLTITATAVEGLTITQNGQPVPTAALGVGLPVDPGEVTVKASAPGFRDQIVKVNVGASGDAKAVTVPPLEKAIEQPPPPGAEEGGSMKTIGFVVGGVGVAAIGLGAVMGIMASGDKSDAEDDPALCPNKQCTPAGREKIDSAESKALISTIGFGVGIAAVGAGVAMILMSGGSDKEAQGQASAQVLPSFDQNGGGFSVVGRF